MTMHIARAEELLSQRRVEPAISELRQHLTQFPDDPVAHAMMARAEAGRGNQKEALKWADRAVHLGPDDGYCHYVRAWILDHFDRYNDAERAAREALRLEPYRAEFYSLAGRICFHKADWQGALQAAEAGLSIDAANIGCINLRALALMRLGRKDIAESAIQSALAEDPEDAISHTNQGWICLSRGERERALEHFREALRLDPSVESARLGLLEALRTKYLLYRGLYSFYDWMNGFNSGVRNGIIIGLYIASRLVSAAGQAHPALLPITIPVMVVYCFFVFLTWTGRATFDIFLRFHPLGRMALSPSQKAASSWVVLCVLSAVVSFCLGMATGLWTPYGAALCFALFAIPTSQIGRYKGRLRIANLIHGAGFAALAALDGAGIWLRTDPQWLINCLIAFIVVCVGYSWIVGIGGNRRG